MSKYTKKVVFDYVMCNDIDGYNIDELENDFEFMKEVFDYTNDKNNYELCDERLKLNFELVKYLINKFKDDKEFILKISTNYLEKAEDNIDKLEVHLMLEEYLDDDEYFKEKYFNKFKTQLFYLTERVGYEVGLNQVDDDVKEFMQMGFYYFFEQYKDRELVTNFIAKKMVDEIFDFKNKNLEKIVHSIFKNKSQIDKISSTKFIIDYISNYDYALGNYLRVHVNIIKELKVSVDRIFKNFDIYNKRIYSEVIDGIRNYIEDYSKENRFSEDILLRKCIGKDLNNKDIWINIGNNITITVQREDEFGFYEDEVELNDDLCDEFGLYECDYDDYEGIKNDILYIRLKENVKRMLDNNEIYDRYIKPYKKEKNNYKCRVLKFDSKKEQ